MVDDYIILGSRHWDISSSRYFGGNVPVPDYYIKIKLFISRQLISKKVSLLHSLIQALEFPDFYKFRFLNLIASSAIIKTVIYRQHFKCNNSSNSDKEASLPTFFIVLHRIVTESIYQLGAARRATLMRYYTAQNYSLPTLLGNTSPQGFHSGRGHTERRGSFHRPESTCIDY